MTIYEERQAEVHTIANPRAAAEDVRLACVRIDDRGDLCVFVWLAWGMSVADACDEAQEHADRQGWGYDPDDVAAWIVESPEIREIVMARCAAAQDPEDIDGRDCIVGGPVDVRSPTIPEHRISIGHLHLDRLVEFIGSPVHLSPFRARQRAVLTVAGQRFTRTLTMTAYGMADPYRVTIGGRRLLISAMTYGQTWDPPCCGSAPRSPVDIVNSRVLGRSIWRADTCPDGGSNEQA